MAVQEPVAGYSWRISGRDEPSTDFIINTSTDFVERKKFPPATINLQNLRWKITGVPEAPKLRRFRRAKVMTAPELSFVFEVLEAPGGANADGASAAFAGFRLEQREHLRSSKGIVYLFDPVAATSTKQDDKTSFTHFFAMLQRLTADMDRSGGLIQGHLPHYVSVCITKFDDPQIFKPAMEAGYVVQPTKGSVPQVPGHLAEDYFKFVGKDDRSKLVRNSLSRYFIPARVRYFATSATGFHLNEDGEFNVNDFENTESDETVPNSKVLRSSPNPVNILEPIIWLERQVSNRAERP